MLFAPPTCLFKEYIASLEDQEIEKNGSDAPFQAFLCSEEEAKQYEEIPTIFAVIAHFD